MKKKYIDNNPQRQEAFLGAVIGAVGNIAGSLITAHKKKKAEEKAYKEQQTIQNRQDTLQQAQTMSADYANQDYIDEYNKKITLKMGGQRTNKTYRNRKSNSYVRDKKFIGGLLNKMGSEGIGGVANLATSLLTPVSAPKTVQKSDGFIASTPKTSITTPNYAASINNKQQSIINNANSLNTTNAGNPIYDDRLSALRMGGKRKAKRC